MEENSFIHNQHIVTEGEMLVTVDGLTYTLCQEDALLIFPNQVHELKTPVHSCHFLCIFSPKLVQAYSKLFTSKVPVSNQFKPDFFFVEKLAALNATDSIMNTAIILFIFLPKFFIKFSSINSSS